jgi:HAMP domain-containing protein
LYIPLKFKLFVPVALSMLGMGVLYQALTLHSLQEDRAKLGSQMAQNAGNALRDELATLVRFRMEELKQLTSELATSGPALYNRATTEFRSEVANITVYTPHGNDGFQSEVVTNRALLKNKDLPTDFVAQLEEQNPLDINSLAANSETQLINRSLSTEEGPVGVLSFVLYSKTMDGNPRGPVIVADLLAESLSARLGRSDTVQAFLVASDGSLLAHAEAEKMVEYRHEAFPQLPQEWITSTTPTGLPGAFVTTQVNRQTVQAVVRQLSHQAWLVMAAMAGVLLVLSLWLASGISRNALNITAALREMAEGKLEHPPRIHTSDEFVLVKNAFNNLLPNMKQAGQSEFDRGFKEAELATVQTLRATMGNPVADSFEKWELVTHRPEDKTSHYEFWDFYTIGNRRQVILGRANANGVAGILLTLMVRVTLNNVRRMADRFSAQRTPSLVEILEMVNGAVFTAFKGKVALVASAFEVDLDTGRLICIHAGGPSAIRWKSSGSSVELDEKSLAGQGAAIGAVAVCNFKTTDVTLPPGERLFMSAPLLQTPSNTGAMAQERLRKTLVSEGTKPLAEVKAAVVSALDTPIFAQSLVFVGIRRPSSEESSATKRAA